MNGLGDSSIFSKDEIVALITMKVSDGEDFVVSQLVFFSILRNR
jgi:hypothetical protein